VLFALLDSLIIAGFGAALYAEYVLLADISESPVGSSSIRRILQKGWVGYPFDHHFQPHILRVVCAYIEMCQ
jgi:hypothetical protein